MFNIFGRRTAFACLFLLIFNHVMAGSQSNADNDTIIKSAYIAVYVTDIGAFDRDLKKTIQLAGGIVTAQKTQNSDIDLKESFLINVPNEKIEQTKAAIIKLAKSVYKTQVVNIFSSKAQQDASEQIALKEAVREKYYGLLKASVSTNEIQQVEAKIESVNKEIEELRTDLQGLQDASMGIIELSALQEINPQHAGSAPTGTSQKNKKLLLLAALLGLGMLTLAYTTYYWRARYKRLRAKVHKVK